VYRLAMIEKYDVATEPDAADRQWVRDLGRRWVFFSWLTGYPADNPRPAATDS
jgi:hypothetical protein